MNAFERAMSEAAHLRARLLGSSVPAKATASSLVGVVEEKLNLLIERVPASYSELGGGSAVLKRNERAIYVVDDVDDATFAYLVAHELGHWVLDADLQPLTVAYLKELTGSGTSPAAIQVEAYGARERQELQANVFARELLLPREVARQLFLAGMGLTEAARELGIPKDIARLQFLDAVLLPPAAPVRPSVLHAPSPDQAAAAKASERFANVVAGPGTGKTSTLVHRVRYLVEEQGVHPRNILVLTFTNKAAFELIERLRAAGIQGASEIWAGTFHAFGLEFLRKYHQRFDLPQDVFVADRLNVMSLLVRALPQADLKHFSRLEDPYDWLQPVITGIKRLKEELVTPEMYSQRLPSLAAAQPEVLAKREDVAKLFALHEAELRRTGMVDFVDLVALPATALQKDPQPFAELVDGFHHVLVDEYQDVTQAMVELVRQLAFKAKTVWVVGDVRQAIHHWRGASVKSLLRFENTFVKSATDGRTGRYSLDVNRRSSTEIVELMQQVGRAHVLQDSLPLDPYVSSKGESGVIPTLITCGIKTDVPAAVVDGVRACLDAGVPLGSQAVLARKGADVERLARALGEAAIPVLYIGELSQRAEIKKLLCLMQILAERQPWGLIGLSGDPSYGMDLADIRTLLTAGSEEMRWQRGRWLRDVPPGLSPRGVEVVSILNRLLTGVTRSTKPWDFVCDMLLERRLFPIDLTDRSIAGQVSRLALWQFAYSVRNGDGDVREARLSRYLMRQRLRQRIGDTYVDRELPPEALAMDAVRLQTVHGSKGLEYDAVHVGYVEDGSYGSAAPTWVSPDSILDIVPPEVLGSSAAEYEFETAIERNNLLYVATSRARTYLRLYDDEEFGGNDRAEQLEHFPRTYAEESFGGAASGAVVELPALKGVPPPPVDYSAFETYTRCGLQYHYRYRLELRIDLDLEVGVRARIAVMHALRGIANGEGTPKDVFLAAWAKYKLPSSGEDPTLWRDAVGAVRQGLQVINAIGGEFCEPTTVIVGLQVNMPWGLRTNERYGSTLHLIRFSSRGASDTATLMRPMVNELDGQKINGIVLHNIRSDQTMPVAPSKALKKTKSAKAALRLLDQDFSPVVGRHCGRCAFMTSCPSQPR